MSVPQPSPLARLLAMPLRPPSLLLLWTVGALLLTALYWVVFYNFLPNVTPLVALLMAVSNVGPLALLAALTRAVLKTYVMPQGVAVQYLAHIVLAPSFAVIWYWAVLLLQALGSATHTRTREPGCSSSSRRTDGICRSSSRPMDR